VNRDQVLKDLEDVPGVLAVHELHVWELAKFTYISMIHLVARSSESNRAMLENVHNLMMRNGVFSSTVQIEFADDFPEGIEYKDACFYGSCVGKKKRAFVTPAVYRHGIGCPHLNVPGGDHTSEDEEHHHDHGHGHDHEHGHDHKHHDHKHEHNHDEMVEA
jgi:heme exporter protein D